MTNLFQVGAAITLHDNVSGALAVISRHMMGMHGTINQLQGAFSNLRLGIVGAFSVITGGAVLFGLEKIGAHADKLLHTMKQMENQGWKSGGDLEEARRHAFLLSGKYRLTKYDENLEIIKEMAPVLGSREHALHLAEPMVAFTALMRGTLGEKGTNYAEQVRQAVKALELKGVMMDAKTGELKPELFKSYIEGMGRTLVATSGLVTPRDYFQFVQYARASGMSMSEDFFLNIAPTLMQEMGGAKAGTSSMSSFQALIGGQMTQRSAKALARLGLLDDATVKSYGHEGLTPKKFGELVGKELFLEDQFMWFQKVLKPALARKGITERQQLIEALGQIFGNRTAQTYADVLTIQDQKILRDKLLYGEARPLHEAVTAFGRNDPMMAKEAMWNQWDRALTKLGEAMAPIRIALFDALAGLFNAIAEFAENHSGAVQVIAVAVTSLAAALAVFGTVLLGGVIVGIIAAAEPITLVIGGIAAVIVGFATVAWAYWPEIKGFFSWLTELPGRFWDWTKSTASSVWEWIKGIPGRVWDSVKSIGSSFIDAITALPGMVGNAISNAISSIGRMLMDALEHLNPFSKTSYGGAPLPPARRDASLRVEVPVTLDGRQIARVVADRMAGMLEFSPSVGGMDTRNSWAPPGAVLGV